MLHESTGLARGIVLGAKVILNVIVHQRIGDATRKVGIYALEADLHHVGVEIELYAQSVSKPPQEQALHLARFRRVPLQLPGRQTKLRVVRKTKLLNGLPRQSVALKNLDLGLQERFIGRDILIKVLDRLNLRRVGFDLHSRRGPVDWLRFE